MKKTRELDNGIVVLDVGYRRDTPVALVIKKYEKYDDEHIIAFHYKIQDNKMDWGYAYYYGNKVEKAKNDFKDVLAGKSLADTFNEEVCVDDEITKLVKDTEKYIRSIEEYENYNVDYVLVDKNNPNERIVVASEYADLIEVNPNTLEITTLDEWAYDIDYDFLGKLEKDKNLIYMSMGCHYGTWSYIQDVMPRDELEHKKGLQEYLKYCKKNGITKEKLEKETNMEIADMMKYHKPDKNKSKGKDR